jgi:hypothetical protein
MVSKSRSVTLGFVSTVALTGAVLAASIVPGMAWACPYADKSSPSNSFTSGDSAGPTETSITTSDLNGVNKFDLNKLGIAGAGFLGLLAGGLFLKSRLTRPQIAAEQPESVPEAPAYKAASVFPIEVPPAALSRPEVEAAAKEPVGR